MPKDVALSSSARQLDDTGKQPQAERAYRALKRLILDNELPSGAQLLEQEAALRLGMSRTPVREAMVRLQQEGMVEIRPRHGMRVLPVSLDDMREIYDMLTVLEALAARRAAERGITKSVLAALEGAVRDMDQALARDDREAWAEADTRFHALLVAASGSQRLEGAIANVVDQSSRARRLTLQLRPKPTASNEDHRAVVEAIKARDGNRAHALHFEHRERNGRQLIDLLAKLRLPAI
jgi:DNA-binding GntR family transcriptional regulator